MTDINVSNFNPGGIIDRVDNRDYQLNEIVGAGATLPFDWTVPYDVEAEMSKVLSFPNFKLTVKDQGGSYSCGGQAWAYLAEILEAINTVGYEPRSAKYVYSQTYQIGGGSTGRDNANIYVNQGVSRESMLASYDRGLPPSEAFITRSADITDAIRVNATLDKSSIYAQVPIDINVIAKTIRDNYCVILGVDGQNNGTWVSEFPAPPTTTEWRHWVCAIKAKMVNGVKHIGFINSWGTTVGVNGIQWLAESYFTSGHIFSCWVHTYSTAVLPVAFKHNFGKDVKYGQTSAEITALQTALQLERVFPQNINPTGYYGQITSNAVLAFRIKYNISSVTDTLGKTAGPLTRAKLNMLYNV